MSLFVLDIETLPDGAGWSARWTRDDRPFGDPFRVESAAKDGIRALGSAFLALFEQQQRPLVGTEQLRGLGRTLHATWFRSTWGDSPVLPSGPHTLIVRSPEREVLNLPWELVELLPDLPLGCDAAWTLLRTPLAQLTAPPASLPPGPLRVLFLAADPLDQGRLDFEREEDVMLRATSGLGEQVVVHFAETGGIDELADLVAEVSPHVVHLSGHGYVDGSGTGHFAFESEEGRTDSRPARDLVELFRGSGVRCVFLNGCQTAQAAQIAGLCQALVAAGIPQVLGWAASVADDRATAFTAALYRRVVRGEPLAAAAAHARRTLRQKTRVTLGQQELQDATFALAQLYAHGPEAGLFDRAAPPAPYAGPRTRYFDLGDGIKGLREGFVGRRRQLQRVLPALRHGEKTMVVLTGIGGAGKSTLATRLANRLHADGFRILPVRASEGRSPSECARATLDKILATLSDAFAAADRPDLRDRLSDGKMDLAQRLRLAVQGLNELRMVLVLDNFEDCLHTETRAIADPDLAAFYRELADKLTLGSRVLVTCRYLPAETPENRATLLHADLTDLEPHDRRKLVRRDSTVERRIAQGELGMDLLETLFAQIGGTPGFLETARSVLRTIDPDELEQELSGITEGAIAGQRAAYLQRIFTERLYQALSPAAQSLVSRLALSELPLPVDAVSGVAELDAPTTERALNEGVVYGLLQRLTADDGSTLYHPPGILRPWLSGSKHLPEETARAVHTRLAAFWQQCFVADRNIKLGIHGQAVLEACRHHARVAPAPAAFRWATVRLGLGLHRVGEWKRALKLLEEVPENERDAECLFALANVEDSLGDWKQARAHLEQASSLGSNNPAQESLALLQLATLDVREGNYPAARRNFERSLAITQALGDRAGEATTWHNLATIDLREGNYPAARRNFERARQMLQTLGDRYGEAATWHQLATLDVHEGDYPAARRNFERSLAIKQALGDRAGEATTWHNLASIDLNEGNYPAARRNFERARQMLQTLGDRAGEATTWHQLASIDLREGNYPAARRNFERARQMRQAIGDRYGEAATFFQLGMLAIRTGKAREGACLIGVCWMIDQAIGHGDAPSDLQQFLGACERAGLTTEQEVRALIEEIQEEYQRDRGATLLARAFGEEPAA